MIDRWGRFTVHGGREVEQQLAALGYEAASVVGSILDRASYLALIMLGGYGRGEGGVETRDGSEHAHNNVDLLLILSHRARRHQQQIENTLHNEFRALESRHGIGIDFSTVTETTLQTSPCLVMWYDMRFGHKTLLGDPEFVPSLKRFEAERILPGDARNLLVNRGTLLLINDLLEPLVAQDEEARRLVLRHAMKAVIGYGDALLFFLGAYHWSYLEKLRRVKTDRRIPEAFQTLYVAASEFRFAPDYARWESVDLSSWSESVREVLADIHLTCERMRLDDPELEWTAYPHRALRHVLTEDATVPRQLAKKLLNWLVGPGHPGGAPWPEQVGFRFSGTKGLLPLMFPVVAYELDMPGYRRLAQAALSAPTPNIGDLRLAYLAHWGERIDDSLGGLLARFGLSFVVAEEVAA
jgi:hypothetical protein